MIMICILLHTNKKKPLEVNLRASVVCGDSAMGEPCDSFDAFYCNRF